MKCLPSTGLPTRYYMALDKATVKKRTNQAVIICPTINGVKVPIVVGAPEVYKHSDDGVVEGEKAEDSANQALEQIKENLVILYWIIWLVSYCFILNYRLLENRVESSRSPFLLQNNQIVLQ